MSGKSVIKKAVSVSLCAAMMTPAAAVAESFSVAAAEGEFMAFSVIGDFTGWTDDIDMSDPDGDGIYEASIAGLSAGSHSFKVRADYRWEDCWGVYEIDHEGTYNSQTNVTASVSEGQTLVVRFDTRGYSYLTWPVSYTVSSDSVAVTGITLNRSSASMQEGATLNLTATVSPSNATDQSVTWSSSDTSVATVSNGAVTARGAGRATITARTSNGKTATCAVTVSASTVAVTSVTLNQTSLYLDEGDVYTLSATVSPSNATDRSLTWSSSDTSVATVSNGAVTARGEGTATITARSSNGKTASCTVTVTEAYEEPGATAPTSIVIDSSAITLEVDDYYELEATVFPLNATDRTVVWTTSDSSVARVSGGLVTAVGTGVATITALTSYGKSATCTVTVTAPAVEVESITLDRESNWIYEDESFTLTATISPSNATDKTVTWISSDTSVATVSNGVVKAKTAGTATITATTANGKTATCEVYVEFREEPVEDPHDYSNEYDYDYDYDGGVTIKRYIGYDSEIEIPDFIDGRPVTRIAGVEEGTASISGPFLGVKSITIPDTVKTVEWNAFTYNESLEKITIGSGVSCFEKQHIDSVAEEYIDDDGNIRYTELYADERGEGQAFYGCTNLKEIIVSPTNRTYYSENGVLFNKAKTILFKYPEGKSGSYRIPDSVKVIGYQAFSGAEKMTSVVFGSNITTIESQAFTNCNGLKAVSIPAKVTSIGDFAFAYCNNLVSVTLPTGSLTIGGCAFENCPYLKDVTIPEGTKSIGLFAFGYSYDISIGYWVPISGFTIRGKYGSTANKYATDNKFKFIRTDKVAVSSIKLSKTSLSLDKGKSATLSATVSPSTANDKKVTWKSSNTKVATVSNGKITAKGKGTATITASTSNGKKATCKVTVKIAVTKVKLSTTKFNLNKGKSKTIKATVTPSDATDKKVTWKSSNKKIATVSSSGKVTAKGKGTATITATAGGKKATCKVTVKVPATKIKLNKTKASLMASKTLTLKATVTPKDTTDKVSWSTSSAKIATVSSKGVVTAKKKGTVTITAKTTSGKKASCKITVTPLKLSDAQKRFRKVVDKIKKKGFVASDGNKTLTNTYYTDGRITVGISYDAKKDAIHLVFGEEIQSDDGRYTYKWLVGGYLYYSSLNKIEFTISDEASHYLYYSKDYEYAAKTTINPAKFSSNSQESYTVYDLKNTSGISLQQKVNGAAAILDLAISYTDKFMREYSLTVKDLGFKKY